MSASLPINFPPPDSPEYDEISDTEIDRYVSKTLVGDAVHEMDIKFGVLKAILEEYAVWCEIRIDPIVMMYFVHKFHTECALYMLQHYGIHVDVRRYENELIRRTEDPNWTDAQKLKRKVLQRRKSNSTKKKICAKRVGDVFNELLAGEFNNVLKCGSFSIAKISALIECSKSKRDFFSRTLCKYDKYGELPGLLEKVLVNNWISFFYCLPLNGFGESDTLNEYERVHRDLPLNVPPSTHITFLSDIKEWFIHMKNRREREERGRRGNEERQREAEILRKREDENNSRKRFSLLEPGSIFYRLLQATASLFGMTPAVSRASTSD
ncbi:unnamed protein product, partial [Mesorhabditis belari]|uniref:Uncharacterized protein n=1 Tax=Mesorhabditis belari TaxID=2138241 RepID=A0AAF3EJA2_9BILA